jgi:hypothetical protein
VKRRLDGCFFHGAKVRFGRFDPSKAADGHAQEGCGFYFTSERSDAWTHAAPGGAILSARLRIDRLLPSAGRVSVTEVRRLVKASPVLNDLLINWDEDPDRAFDMAVHSMMSSGTGPKAVFDQIWYDFYRDHPAAYLTAVTGLGYDGAVISRPGNAAARERRAGTRTRARPAPSPLNTGAGPPDDTCPRGCRRQRNEDRKHEPWTDHPP